MTKANKREQIWQSLDDFEYRHQFVEEEISVGIAFQIRALRNKQNLTQIDLANLMNVKQPLVPPLENPNYGKYTLSTLRRLAKAFDVGLLVRFVPFSKLADLAANLTPDDIAPPSFNEEQSYVSPAPSNYVGSTISQDANTFASWNPNASCHISRVVEGLNFPQFPSTAVGMVGEKELVYAGK